MRWGPRPDGLGADLCGEFAPFTSSAFVAVAAARARSFARRRQRIHELRRVAIPADVQLMRA